MSKPCTCETCKGACRVKPGWMLPNDIPKMASFLGVSEEQLARKHLGVDYWMDKNDTKVVFVLAPRTEKIGPGQVYPMEPCARCLFFTDDERCAVHPAKPHECRQWIHGEKQRRIQERKQGIVRVWRRPENQEYLIRLVGYEPKLPELTPAEAASLMFH